MLPYSFVIFPKSTELGQFLFIIEVIIGFAFLWSLTARRWHDMGKSALPTDPFEGAFEYFVCLLGEGEKKGNKYGKPPVPKIDIKKYWGYPNISCGLGMSFPVHKNCV